MNEDNNEMKIELPSLKGQNNDSDNSNGPVLSEKPESAIVYLDTKDTSSAVNSPVEEKREVPASPVTPVIEEKNEEPITPVAPVIEEYKEENINYSANLETPKTEVNQTPLTNNSENVYVSNSVANANTINQETSTVAENANLNSVEESTAPATEPYMVNNTPINEPVTPLSPISEPAMEPSNPVNEPAPVNNPTPVEPVVAPINNPTPIETVVAPTPIMTPITENNAGPITNVNPSTPIENNNVANPNLGPVNNSQPINNIPTNTPVTNSTVVASEPKVNKASKKATIIGTVIALIITALLLFWFVYNYCIID